MIHVSGRIQPSVDASFNIIEPYRLRPPLRPRPRLAWGLVVNVNDFDFPDIVTES